jgi:hypothetical protein
MPGVQIDGLRGRSGRLSNGPAGQKTFTDETEGAVICGKIWIRPTGGHGYQHQYK